MDETKFKELYFSKLSIGKIAFEMGVCEETIRNWATKLNLPKRRIKKSLVGQTFGTLYVDKETNKRYQGSIIYNCLCLACNNYHEIIGRNLKISKTCGCGRKTGFGEMSGKYWANILKNAKLRKIEVFITKEDVWKIYQQQNGRCAISKLEISFKDKTASLDRIDSTKGYTIDNIQWLHKEVNMMKWKLSQERFIELCMIISNCNTKEII